MNVTHPDSYLTIYLLYLLIIWNDLELSWMQRVDHEWIESEAVYPLAHELALDFVPHTK